MDTLINRLDSRDTDFTARLDRLLSWEGVSDAEVQHRVTDILARVKQEGDAALVEFSNRFDRLSVSSMAELVIGAERLAQGLALSSQLPLAQPSAGCNCCRPAARSRWDAGPTTQAGASARLRASGARHSRLERHSGTIRC